MDENQNQKKYRLGYALGGGGAKGFAHLGAFKVFEKYGIKPDIIAGTSAGALAGVLYADGFAPEEIADLFRGHKLMDFAELSLFSGGILKPSGVARMLKKNLRAKNFEQLKIPFVAVATNWETAEITAFREGDDLVSAVVASCTVPIVFQPLKIKGVEYVDGGVLKNFPVSVIREETECVVGINLYQLSPFESPSSIKSSAMRYFEIISKANMKEDIELADILIDMKGLKDYKMFELKAIDDIVNQGEETTSDIISDPSVCQELMRMCSHQSTGK